MGISALQHLITHHIYQPDAMETDKTSSHQASYLSQWVKDCRIIELLAEGAIK
ncbi:hypothetical protein CUMW_223010 [Citrus unshiu]|uniref:Uncharacterized protein n=1 Tax=Citrus unshiu TaxID=55188 RepID=A0A2H5QEP1_CITUN|nr:hypothetical protein CUMW_223010 [Citrus unshiu]